ncbi:MAG: helix-turn-helix domain-containing protein [Eubacterium sp.]|nr:helix-turn-helix domain-containing protein [Eubacterium sp.]
MYNDTPNPQYETTHVPPELGFEIRFVTMKHNSPLHWHAEMEILYILNGSALVTLNGQKHALNPLDLIVIDSSMVHDVIYDLPQTMGICIHISKPAMRQYLGCIDTLHFSCLPVVAEAENKEAYTTLCQYLKDLTLLYFEQKQSYPFTSSACILLIMAVLVEKFANPIASPELTSNVEQMERIQQIFQYVEQHYQMPISLEEAAGELGINKEYFCRFFKKSTGVSFLKYVNKIRLNHVYHDLLYTNGSIQEIMERNGFYNAKLFHRLFKEVYHCTPRELRQATRDNPYMG